MEANATRSNAPVPIASLKTTPKLSDVKQYYALGFFGSVIQTGQHEDGLSLLHYVWGISWENSIGGGAGIIWRYPPSGFWDRLLAGTSAGCWPEHLHRASACGVSVGHVVAAAYNAVYRHA